MRELLETEPYLFGPGVYDPMGAQLAMYHGFKAVYFSGYSFAIGHLGTTDMDIYDIGRDRRRRARRTVSALRKFQLTMAVGDPEKGIAPRHLEIPPVIVDMDGGYGNIFNVQRTAELLRQRGRRRGPHRGPGASEALRPHRRQGADPGERDDRQAAHGAGGRRRLGNDDFVIIARTDGLSAVDAPEPERGLDLAVDRALRYLDTGIPDLLWCEFPTSDRGAARGVRRSRSAGASPRPASRSTGRARSSGSTTRTRSRSPSSASWASSSSSSPSAASTRWGTACRSSSQRMGEVQEHGYIELQREEWADGEDFPTRSHHFFSGVPYHHLVGKEFDAARLGQEFVEELPDDQVV